MNQIAITLLTCFSVSTAILGQDKTEAKKDASSRESQGALGFGDEGPQYAHFDQLIDAVKTLRGKKIREAYFWLESPQVPGHPVFAPDTKGGAYIIVSNAFPLPKGSDATKLIAEFKEEYKDPKKLTFDEEKNEILFSSKASWLQFQKKMAPWIVDPKKIEDTGISNLFPGLIIEIPKKQTKEFLLKLLEAWGLKEKEFRFYPGWN